MRVETGLRILYQQGDQPRDRVHCPAFWPVPVCPDDAAAHHTDDPQQTPALVIIDLTDPHSYRHRGGLARQLSPHQEATSVGQSPVGLRRTYARTNPWLRSTFATCSV
ncbi:hypothetical protein GCM10010392_43800 [Streptomyces clavifer]|nr:hypothetical protein GCM10010392_43800 [Streptomyces clavifer]